MSARGYGALDLGFAALYAYLGFRVAPSRSPAFQLSLGAMAALLGLAGAALLAFGEARAARWLGVVASGALLVFTVAVVGLLVASGAFLLGVYSQIGRGVGLLALVAAALAVELFGLLPFFQLRFHLRARR